jgi:hypothetical protein
MAGHPLTPFASRHAVVDRRQVGYGVPESRRSVISVSVIKPKARQAPFPDHPDSASSDGSFMQDNLFFDPDSLINRDKPPTRLFRIPASDCF